MKWYNVILVGALGLVLASYSNKAVSSFFSNRGLLEYLNFLTNDLSDNRATLIQITGFWYKAMELDPSNIGAHRGLGFVFWDNGKDADALAEWQQAGLTAQDYIVFGQHEGDRETALRWYALAERLEPENPELWMEVGLLCQYNPQNEACVRFLSFNHDNWLVDPEFVFDGVAWRFNRREGADYAITDCPDLPTKKCALVRIDAVTSPHGTGWQQCLVLESGRQYRFSAWIKVETEGQWIPIYYQGSVDGVPKGYNLAGVQIGDQEWKYWEQVFTAPMFDQNRACFHPVRLLDVGVAWFHSAALWLVK